MLINTEIAVILRINLRWSINSPYRRPMSISSALSGLLDFVEDISYVPKFYPFNFSTHLKHAFSIKLKTDSKASSLFR